MLSTWQRHVVVCNSSLPTLNQWFKIIKWSVRFPVTACLAEIGKFENSTWIIIQVEFIKTGPMAEPHGIFDSGILNQDHQFRFVRHSIRPVINLKPLQLLMFDRVNSISLTWSVRSERSFNKFERLYKFPLRFTNGSHWKRRRNHFLLRTSY